MFLDTLKTWLLGTRPSTSPRKVVRVRLSGWKQDGKGNWTTTKDSSFFARSYGMTNPREDWSTGWESYFTKKHGLGDTQSLRTLPQGKTDHLDAFFASLR